MTTNLNIKYLVFYYHRPFGDSSSGQGKYINDIINSFPEHINIELIAPANIFGNEKRIYTFTGSLVNLICMLKKQIKHQLGAIIHKRREICVIFDIYSAPLPLFFSKLKGFPIVYVASDVGSDYSRELLRIKSTRLPILTAERIFIELLLMKWAKLVVVRSEYMKNELQRSGVRNSSIMVCKHQSDVTPPNVVDIMIMRKNLGLDNAVGILFLGNCNYAPNDSAVKFILKRILPALNSISDRVPTKLILVGSGTEKYNTIDKDRLIAMGKVKDINNILYCCDIGLAPMEVTGGTSAKVIDYLTHGLLVISTMKAVKGVTMTDEIRISELRYFPTVLLEVIKSVGWNDRRLLLDERINRKINDEYSNGLYYDKFRAKLIEMLN